MFSSHMTKLDNSELARSRAAWKNIGFVGICYMINFEETALEKVKFRNKLMSKV